MANLNFLVGQFIDHASMTWNVDKLYDSFDMDSVDIIIHIPLNRNHGGDQLIWDDILIGCYKVKSGYFMARTLLGKSNSSPTERKKLWYYLWSSKVILKINFFVAFFHGILPTVMALKSRGMNLDLHYWVCGEHEECVMHLFFECTYSRKVWSFVLPFDALLIIDAAQGGNWEDFMNLCNDRAWIDILFYTCWFLWKNQNQTQFEMYSKSPMCLFKSIYNQMQEFIKVIFRNTSLGLPQVSTWTILAPGFLQINVDASWNSHEKVDMVAVIVHEHSGATVCCATRRHACCSAVLHAELLAIKFGLKLALNHRYTKILLESDSLMAIKDLEKGFISFYEWGVLVMTLLALMISFSLVQCLIQGGQLMVLLITQLNFFKEYEDYNCWIGCDPNLCCNPNMI